MNENNMGLFIKALHLSARQHSTQRRKDAQATAYINHPVHLVKVLWEVGKVDDINVLVAALLHDTLEDTVRQGSPEDEALQKEIEQLFGSKVLGIIKEVTDDKSLDSGVNKEKQVAHAKTLSHEARLVKLADKLSNVSDIIINPPSAWPVKRKEKYLDWAERVVNEIRGTNPDLEKEFDTWVARGRSILAEMKVLGKRFEVIPGSGEVED